jgi:uncharacterized protein
MAMSASLKKIAGLLALSLLLAVPALATEPAFDCAKADGSVEELICQDSQLAALDREIARLYGLAAKGPHMDGARLKELKAYQRGWIKGRNDCWKADDLKSCVESEYVIRIHALRQGYFDARQQDGEGVSNGPLVLACEGVDFLIGITFINVEEPLALLEWADHKVTVKRAVSASGARYAGSYFDGDYALWTKGTQAIFTRPEGLQLTCRIEEGG